MTSNSPKQNLQFIDLQAQQARIREQIEARIRRVLDHCQFIMGPEVQEVEERLAAYAGVRHCITCASGTDALLMALMALDIGPGDAVITPPFTFIATAEVIALLGATPVFVDIEPTTFNLDPAKLEQAFQAEVIKSGKCRLRGIMPVDLFGQPADYAEIEAFARQHDLFVVQDAAQSFGAEYRGRKSGSLGDISATSFFPAKPLGCYGDGGAVFTDDDHLAEKLRSIRVHGQGRHKYDNVRIGVNGRFDTIQAAILLAKLDIFDEEIKLRNEVADRYNELLRGVVETPQVKPDRRSVWAQYSVLSDHRDELMARLKAQGIPTAIYYPRPLHLQPAFEYLGYSGGDFPVSESVAQRIFSLPMHPYLTPEDQHRIATAIKG
ncbi:MAG: DegT/DnrJ/EryC1/StrS family aminotransferase [Calditrichaeota bacterium]|nr:MAG: DegT/DnrJ/EryC1/StrS family aminotransferase [Calditrichota bacterium]